MGVSLLAYVVTFFIFLCNYTLTIVALVFPKWLTFVTPIPIYMETNYGLFKMCRSLTRECRPFPSSDHNDCQEDGFCELWRASAAGMVIAAIIGGLTIFALIATMCSQRRKRSKAWAPISFMLLMFALPQAFSMGAIAYLFNSSATFYMVLAIVLSLIAVLSPPEYAYQQLD